MGNDETIHATHQKTLDDDSFVFSVFLSFALSLSMSLFRSVSVNPSLFLIHSQFSSLSFSLFLSFINPLCLCLCLCRSFSLSLSLSI